MESKDSEYPAKGDASIKEIARIVTRTGPGDALKTDRRINEIENGFGGGD